jgi:hypothetical protein
VTGLRGAFVTASQRLRLVIALGAVNLVLAIVAFGLAGTSNVPPESAVRTPAPSATPGPVAIGSPRPSAPAPKPTKVPAQASPAPTTAPEATAAPARTPGPVAVVDHPAATPGPSTVPETPPTATPAGESLRAVPPCPGATSGAPGLTKQAIDPDRPCRGGETAGTRPGQHPAHRSTAHRRLLRGELDGPAALLGERVRPQTRHRIRRRTSATA